MRESNLISYLFFTVALAFYFIACSAAPVSGEKSYARISVMAIQMKSSEFSGKQVQLNGVFKGWRGTCKSAPPKSRSDWMFQDATGCIYVHGALPKGVQPMFPKDEPVSLKAVVRLTADGIPYLDAISPKMPPPNW